MNNNLSAQQKEVLDNKATEPAFTGKLLNNKKYGTYNCVRCGNILISSDQKFDSGSGWPSFYQIVAEGAVKCCQMTRMEWSAQKWFVQNAGDIWAMFLMMPRKPQPARGTA